MSRTNQILLQQLRMLSHCLVRLSSVPPPSPSPLHPHFLCNPVVLENFSKDKARGVLVIPDWPSQPWNSRLASMLTQIPILVSVWEDLLIVQTNPAIKHMLRRTLRLIICAVSGNDSDAPDFRRQLPQLFAHRGGVAQADSMPLSLQDGRGMRANEACIPFCRMWVKVSTF